MNEAENHMQGVLSDINKSLELIVHPTEQCNFRCKYCYEKFKIKEMKPETVLGLKRFLDKRAPELERLMVSWFGGEPMLGYRVITDVMEHIQGIKQKQNPGLEIMSDMTTNASLLNDKKLRRLVGLGVEKYQVSLDGDKEEHDKLRVTVAGGPTFDMIWNNMIAAHNTDLPFMITVRVHVNKENEDSISRLLRRIGNEMGGDRRFTIFIRELSRLGSKNDSWLPIIDNDAPVERLRAQAKDMNLQTQTFDGDEYVCYAAKPNSYVIRADGTVSKCTVALYSDLNMVGKLNNDGTLSLDNEKMALWSRGFFTGKAEDLACPLKSLSRDYDMLKPAPNAMKILEKITI